MRDRDSNFLKILFIYLSFLLLVSCGGSGSGGQDVGSGDVSPSPVAGLEVVEGDDGNNVIRFSYTFANSGLISYETYDIDAVAKSDYVAASGQVSVEAQETYFFDVEIYPDTRIEGDEKLGLLLSSESGAEIARINGTIINDDFPDVQLSAADATEGDIGTGRLLFNVILSESTVDPFVVNVATTDNSGVGYASPVEDYTAINQDLVFTQGQLSKVVEVVFNGDTDIELDEIVQLNVSHNSSQLTSAQATIRSDDSPGDGAPTFVVNNGRSKVVNEGADESEYQVEFSIDDDGGFNTAFTLSYYLDETAEDDSVTADRATKDSDFSGDSTAIEIVPGTETYTVNFTISDDNDIEDVEVLDLILANDAGVEFGRGRIYIADNDLPTFELYTKNNGEVSEVATGEGAQLNLVEGATDDSNKVFVRLANSRSFSYDYEFELVLRFPTNGEVEYEIENNDLDEEENAVDVIKTFSMRAPAGSSEAIVVIGTESQEDGAVLRLKDDALVEGNESLFAELQTTSGIPIGDKVELIVNNDDFVRPYFTTDSISSADEADGDTARSVSIAWDEEIAENSPAMSVRVVASCADSGCTLENDINYTAEGKEFVIYSGSGTPPQPDSSTMDIGLIVKGDTRIEPDETVSFELQTDGIAWVALDKTTTHDFIIRNDDTISPYFIGSQQSANESDTDQIVSIGWDQDIDDNAPQIVVNIMASCAVDGCSLSGSDGADSNLTVLQSFNIYSGPGSGGKAAVGSTGEAFSFSQTDNAVVEPDEAVTLTLLAADSRLVSIGSNSSFIHTIVNDDFITPYFATATSTVTEEDTGSNTDASLLVKWDQQIASNVPDQTLSLTSSCAADECSLGSDINFDGSDSFTISNSDSGSAGKNIGLTVTGDELVEPDEDLQISISNADNTYVDISANPAHTLTVANDDKVKAYFVTANSIANEGEGGGSADAGIQIGWDETIAANLKTALSVAINASCASNGCSLNGATNADTNFNASNNLVEIHAGSGVATTASAGKTIGLTIDQDERIEPDEVLSLTMALNGGTYVELDSSRNDHSRTIVNDDQVLPSFVAATTTAAETDASVDAGVTIQWSETIDANAPAINVTLGAACVANGCELGTDVNFGASQTVAISDGSVAVGPGTKNIGLTVTGDTMVEPDEVLTLSLTSTDTNANPSGQIQHVYTIDNDDFITPYFATATSTVTEEDTGSNTDASLLVKWDQQIASNVPDQTLSLTSSCAADECSLGSDINFDGSDSFTISNSDSGSSGKNIGLTVTGDELVEPDEDLQISISNADNTYVDISANPAHTLTVANDDKVKAYFVTANSIANEGEGGGSADAGIQIGWDETIAANLKTALSVAINASCASNGCSLNGATNADTNFNASNNLVEIHAGSGVATTASAGKTIGLTIDQDERIEPDEVLSLTMALNGGTYVELDSSRDDHSRTIVNDDQVLPSFVAATTTAAETDASADAGVTIQWSETIDANAPAINVTLGAACAANGCELGTDVNFGASQTVAISDGSAAVGPGTKNIGLTVTGDTMVEPDEVLTLSLTSTDTNANPSGQIQHVYTIDNDDFITPYFATATSTVTEEDTGSSTDASLLVKWDQQIASNVPDQTLSLTSSCAADECSLGSDINFDGSDSFTISNSDSGSAGKNIGLTVTGDELVEPDEDLQISISNADNTYVDISANPAHTLTVANDDSVKVYFISSASMLAEGADGQATESLVKAAWDETIAANLKQSLSVSVSASCVVNGCSLSGAAGSDSNFKATNSLEVHPGDGTETGPSAGKLIGLSITGDNRVEPDEVISLGLSAVAPYVGVGSAAVHAFTIENDDKVEPVFVSSDSDQSEGDSNSSYDFKVQWNGEVDSNVPGLPLTLSLATNCSGSDCVAANDYSLSSTSINVNASTNATEESTITLTVVGDDRVEPNERFVLAVSGSSADYIDTSSSTDLSYTLSNDDKVEPVFVFADSDQSEGDSNSNYDFKVQWNGEVDSNVPGLPLTLSLATNCSGSDCVAVNDYSLSSTSINVNTSTNATEESTITLTVVGDDRVEPNERFVLAVTGSSADYIDTSSSTDLVYTLNNDDLVVPELSWTGADGSGSQAEGDSDGTINMKVSWNGLIDSNVPGLPLNLTLGADCSGSSCVSANDYGLDVTSMSVAASTNATEEQNVVLTISGDERVEPDELLNLVLATTSTDYVDLTASNSNTKAFSYTLNNDDKVEPVFVSADSDQSEGDSNSSYDFKVQWNGEVDSNVPGLPLTLSLATNCSGSDCVAANDYSLSSTSINVNASTNATEESTITLTVVGDDRVEPNERFVLAVSGSSADYIDTSSSTDLSYTLSNDDKVEPVFVFADSDQSEGDSNSNYDFKVQWNGEVDSNVPGLPLTLSLATNCSGSDCVAVNDYSLSSTSINVNTSTNATEESTITLTVVGDDRVEPNERFVLAVSGSSADYIDTSSSTDLVYTLNNDDLVVPELSWTGADGSGSQAEGDSDGTINMKVSWNGLIDSNVPGLPLNLTLGADCSGSSCVSANDYGLDVTSMSVAASTNATEEQNVVLTISGDERVEPDELLNLVLATTSTDYVDLTASNSNTKAFSYTLNNDDKVEPVFVSTDSDQSEGDSNSSYDFKVQWNGEVDSNVPGLPLTLSLATNCSGSGCVAANDYSLSSTSINVNASTNATEESTITLTVVGDDRVEPNERFVLAVSGSSADYIDTSSSTDLSYTLSNDDKVEPVFVFADSDQSEGDSNSNYDFKVQWNGEVDSNVPGLPLTLSLATNCSGSDCVAVNDYSLSSTSINVNTSTNATEESTITLTVVGDDRVEPNERFVLAVTGSSADYIDTSSSTDLVYTLNNDDLVVPELSWTGADGSGSQAEGDSDGTINMKVSWNGLIDSNVPGLPLNLTLGADCSGSSCVSANDYGLDVTSMSVAASTNATEEQNVVLTISGDERVEPDELLNLVLATTSTDYVDLTASNSNTKAFSYTLNNDDMVVPELSWTGADGSGSQAEGDSDDTINMKVSWNGLIDSNVPGLPLNLTLGADCSGSSCVSANDYGLDVTSMSVAASTNATEEQNVVLTISGDERVEPDELLNLVLATTSTDYVDLTASNSNTKAFNYTLNNDDMVVPELSWTGADGSGSQAEGDSDGTINMKVSWNGLIDSNVPGLPLNLTLGADCSGSSCVSANDYGLDVTSMSVAASTNATEEQNVVLTISGDERVEPDELLNLVLATTSTDYVDLTASNSNTKAFSYTLNNDDLLDPYFINANSSNTESGASADAGVEIKWDEDIDDNVPAINITLSAACAVSGCSLAADTNLSASQTISISDGTSAVASGTKNVGLNTTADNIVEPDEVVTLTLTEASEYVQLTGTTQHLFTISNDDFVEISSPSTTTQSIAEGTAVNFTVSLAGAATSVAGNISSINVNYSVTENSGSADDFDASDITNSPAITLGSAASASIARPNASDWGGQTSWSVPIVTTNNDDVVELTEVFDVTVTSVRAEVSDVEVAKNITNTSEGSDVVNIAYSMSSDEYLDIKLESLSSFSEVDSNISVNVCLPASKTISDKASGAEFDISSQSILVEGYSVFSDAESGVDYTLVTASADKKIALALKSQAAGSCSSVNVASITDDSLIENNEWFNLAIQSSDLCGGDSNCLGINIADDMTGMSRSDYDGDNDDGFVVIVNNDYQTANDSPAVVSYLSDQDSMSQNSAAIRTETGSAIKPKLTPDSGTVAGTTVPDAYECIVDDKVGYLWYLNAVSSVTVQSAISTDIAGPHCSYADESGRSWQVPSVADLQNISSGSGSDENTIFKFDSSNKYWTRDNCGGSDDNYFVFDPADKTTTCVDSTDSSQEYLSHAVYY